MLLDGALEWAGAELGVETFLRQELAGRVIHAQRELLILQALFHARELDVHDGAELRLVQVAENNAVIHTIQKLRPELPLEFPHHGLTQRVVHHVARGKMLLNQGAGEVAGHDDHRVAEIHRATLAIGQAAVIEHLQQHVEHIRMGLLDFVKEHHAVRPAAHGFTKLSALIVTHVARRRADQP